jgi:hypothetical protein
MWITWSIGSAMTASPTEAIVTPARAIPHPSPSRPGSSRPTRPARLGYLAPPAPIRPQTRPALPREGFWQPLVSVHGQTAIRAAFLRPDGQFTSERIGVAWLNQKLVTMALHPGEGTPGGSGWSQPSQVPSSARNRLLATFNSGFLMSAAEGGYWQDGTTAVPLVRGAASMVFSRDGHIDVVRWNGRVPGRNVAAVRQNLTLLVDHGRVTPEADSASWGATLGGGTYVWRSGVGIRRDGALVFAAGPSLSARTLANVLRDAGALRAMELDINPEWTNFITYTHPRNGVAVPHMLTKDEQPNPYRYLEPSSRDFVAVLARR